MKKNSRILVILLALALVVTFASSCSQDTNSQPTASGQTESQSSGSQEGPDSAGVGMDAIKVGAVINNAVDDGGWAQSHYQSLIRAKEELGLRDDQLVIMGDIPETGSDTENAIEMLISEGCQLIIGNSAGHTGSMLAASSRNPKVYFAQFEGQSGPNYVSHTVRDFEAIFVAGYAAARMSSVDKLGFVAAQPTTSVVRAVNAWAAGALYANPKATVSVVWANDWYNPAIEKEAANSLLDSGIECLGYHGSTTAVMLAAQEHGGYATGFHIDMKSYAPKAVLTSFMWNWTPVYSKLIKSVAEGSWSNNTIFMGLDTGAASLSPFNADLMPADVIADCEAVMAKVASGEIEVFKGPLKDNLGQEVLAEGESFSNEAWMSMMYLAENVIGELP